MFKVMISKDMEWFDRSENGVGSLGARLAGEPFSVQNVSSRGYSSLARYLKFLFSGYMCILGYFHQRYHRGDSFIYRRYASLLEAAAVCFMFHSTFDPLAVLGTQTSDRRKQKRHGSYGTVGQGSCRSITAFL